MDYTIYILAQGKSSRIGTDKGLVKINGQEMIGYCIDHLKPLQQEIVIITANDEYKKFEQRLIPDKVNDLGPAQGVITALEDSNTSKNLIVSCDMPLIDVLMIRKFNGLLLDESIVCFEDEFLYPFPGIYTQPILPVWKKEVASGNHKMQDLIKQFNYKSLPIDNPELFLNINTPADILVAEERLK